MKSCVRGPGQLLLNTSWDLYVPTRELITRTWLVQGIRLKSGYCFCRRIPNAPHRRSATSSNPKQVSKLAFSSSIHMDAPGVMERLGLRLESQDYPAFRTCAANPIYLGLPCALHKWA